MEGQSYACLFDRIRVNSGEKQRYGTQFAKVDFVNKTVSWPKRRIRRTWIGITLLFFPWLILKAFDTSLIPPTGPWLFTGLAIFSLFSILGLASARTLVKAGSGTPLPLDQTTRLVVSGPYRFVRNPMAIAGIGQGIAISIIYTSLPIFIYAILGAILWQIVVRPVEEKNLSDRFGDAYEDYRKKVPCWIPHFYAKA